MKAKKRFKDTLTIITGNFKKSPATTVTGAVVLLVGVILLVTKPEHEVISYSLMTAGASLLGIKDFWKPKKQNQNVKRSK